MTLLWPDRTLETTVTAGTGAFALAGAVTGYKPFSDRLSVSDTVYGARFAVDAAGNPSGPYETGLFTYSAANQLTMTVLSKSSNGDAAVSWTGTQWVMACPIGENYTDWLESMAAALTADDIGVSIQAYSANLAEYAAVNPTAAGLALLDDADAAAQRTTLGVYSTSEVDAADADTLTDAETYTDAAIAAISGNGAGTPPNGVVSGLGLVYTGSGLTWSMSAGTANINGDLVAASAQTVTLAAADATNPRLDTFYLDDTGTFNKITGTAATNPSLPTVDPTSQLYLGFALVPATATDLTSTITTEAIYTEGAEWTGTASGSGVTIGSTNHPKTGTKSIEFTAVAANAYAKFVDGSPASFDGTSSTLFSIRSQGAWNSKRSINIQYFNASGVAVGTPVVFKEGSFGFVSSNSASYQDVVVPETLFAVPVGTVRGELRFTVKGTGGTMGFYLDDIKVQTIAAGSGGTGGGGVSNGITQDQADARYLKLSGGTVTGPVVLPSNAYGAGWNGSLKAATEDAVYDKIESVIAGTGVGDMLKSDNLSGLANYATARTNLGLSIGVNVQAYNANLTTFAGIAPSANVQTLMGAANYAAFKTSLSLTVGTDVQAYNANLTTYAGIAPSANVQTLLGAANYAAFKTSLSLTVGTDVQAYSAALAAIAGATYTANVKPLETLILACSDETTAITTGTAKVTFRMPYAFTVTAVRASVTTAPTGSTILIDINESGTTILSTKLMIDATEKTSTTATTAYVISDSSLADDAEITIDFDQVGSTIAGAGVKVYLIGNRT